MSEVGRYSKVSRRIWSDEKFRSLSKPKPSAQGLLLRLLTAPEGTNIPGLFQAWDAGIAQSMGWGHRATVRCLNELINAGFVEVDRECGLFFLPNAIKHNEPQSINVIIGWKTAWSELPECDLKDYAETHLREWAASKGAPWLEAFDEATGKAYRKASEKPKPMPKAKPSAIQKQEQEQKQEQFGEGNPKTLSKPKLKASPKPPPDALLDGIVDALDRDPGCIPRESGTFKIPNQSHLRAFETAVRTGKIPVPDNFQPNSENISQAKEFKIDLEPERLKFINHYKSHKKLSYDWQTVFSSWLIRESGYKKEREKPKPGSRNGPVQPNHGAFKLEGLKIG